MNGHGSNSDGEIGHAGTMHASGDGFGLIKPDIGGDNIVVLPLQCMAFGGALPQVGARLFYNLTLDPLTKRPRAADVIPQEYEALLASQPVAPLAPSPQKHLDLPNGVFVGSMDDNLGAYGFIRPDDGGPAVFVMPGSCEVGVLPHKGARVVYTKDADSKTGEPAAAHVMSEESFLRKGMPASAMQPQATTEIGRSGTMLQENGQFGFIAQDNGEAAVLVMSAQCDGHVLPGAGAKVSYTVTKDKTGRPKAEKVRVEKPPPVREEEEPPPPQPAVLPEGRYVGRMLMHQRKFGYIQQDNGAEDMYVLPGQCTGFGYRLPPDGTRVMFGVGVDPQNGRMRAEDVQPEPNSGGHWGNSQDGRSSSSSSAGVQRGTVLVNRGGFGYIKQDSGAADLLVTPGNCVNNSLPSLGSRVVYSLGRDPNEGVQIAENVYLEEQYAAISRRQTGTMKTDNGTFGFITLDSGNPDVFVTPTQCFAFDCLLPPVGTRLTFEVGQDVKTKKLRAEDVQPQNQVLKRGFEAAPSYGKANGQGGSQGGSRGKGFAAEAHPYR